jgi:integrase
MRDASFSRPIGVFALFFSASIRQYPLPAARRAVTTAVGAAAAKRRRIAVGLSVKRVEKLLRAGAPGRHTDGDVRGLMLCIEGPKSAHWLLRWQRDHKVRHMGLGSARDLPLASAREKARDQRERIARDIDPLERKHADREALRQAEAKRVTFKQAATRWYEAHQSKWTNAAYATEVLASLERYAFDHIGKLDVSAIDRDAVLRVLEQKLPGEDGTFWTVRSQTADRTRNRVEKVLDFATVRGWRSGDNPARWKSFLDQVLPAPRALAPVKHLAATPYDQLPRVMAAMAADGTVAAKAARFTIMTNARLSEAIEAPLEGEIDFEAREWRVPPERMKGRRPHTVPLSPQAIELLKSLPTEEGNQFLFIGNQGAHVSGVSLTEALRRAGCTQTLHGMRSAFSDWAHERTSFPPIIIELSLAHRVGTATENAYRRTDLATKRRRLMEAWAKFCCTPPMEKQKGEVVALRA